MESLPCFHQSAAQRSESCASQVFAGHTKGVWSVAFSPDGRYVVSGSRDQTLRLWLVSGPYDWTEFLGGLKPAAHLTDVDPTGASLFKFDNAKLGPGLDWRWQLAPNGLTLMVVPEPGTLALLTTGAFGLLLLVCRRRWKT